jgi:hypothetical protein
MSRVRLVASLVVACCSCVFLAPAAAKPPSLHWQLVGEPTPWQQLDQTQFQPRVELAVANDVPYVASLDTQSRLTVWRPNRRETGWVQLGGPLNHDLSRRAREVSITTSGRTVWVAWDEHDLSGVSDVHLAKLVGDSFREVGVGTQLTGGGASVEIYGGRPYVAYGGAPVQVVRLSRDGRTFEHLDAPSDGNDATLAVSGGRLWLVHESRVGGEGLIRVLRLDARRDRWQTILTRPGFNVHEQVDFRGSLYAPRVPGCRRFPRIRPARRAVHGLRRRQRRVRGATGVGAGGVPRRGVAVRGQPDPAGRRCRPDISGHAQLERHAVDDLGVGPRQGVRAAARGARGQAREALSPRSPASAARLLRLGGC